MLQNTQTQIKNNMQDLVNNANHSSALVASPAVQIKGSDGRYKTLKEFYPFYLSQHEDPTCRRLHFVGTTCVIGITAAAGVATIGQAGDRAILGRNMGDRGIHHPKKGNAGALGQSAAGGGEGSKGKKCGFHTVFTTVLV